MKKCPNCGELIGDNVSECFNCHYNYIYKRIITQQEPDTPTAKARWVLIYIHFQIYSKAYKTNKFL